MNSRLLISALVLFAAGLYTTASAQEDRMPDLESGREMRYDPPSTLDTEDDTKGLKPAVQARDSVYQRPAQRRPDTKGKQDDNPSVLGFNFLYYLIERYKLSDIVD